MAILNSRETAILIWFALVLVWATWKAKAWSLVVGLFRSFCKPIFLRAIAVMAAYVGACVWLMARIDLWRLDNLKTTLVWFGAFVLGWIFNMKRWDADPKEDARATLRELLSVTVLVTFLTEFYTFHLALELVLVPVVTFIALMASLPNKPETAIVTKVFGALLAIIGWGLLAYAAFRLVEDFAGFATADTSREFAAPALLSLLFLPFMYLFNIWAAYETVGRVLPIALKEPGVAGYALRSALLAFRLDVNLLRRWRGAVFNLDPITRDDVRVTISMMLQARARERNPPLVAQEDGWVPSLACSWLASLDLPAKSYNPKLGDWGASSPYRKLDDATLGDSLAYYVSGSALAATHLKLTLNLDRLRKDGAKPSSLEAYSEAVITLMSAVFGDRAPQALSGLKSRRHRTKQGLFSAVLKEEEDALRLTITHAAHVEPDYVRPFAYDERDRLWRKVWRRHQMPMIL